MSNAEDYINHLEECLAQHKDAIDRLTREKSILEETIKELIVTDLTPARDALKYAREWILGGHGDSAEGVLRKINCGLNGGGPTDEEIEEYLDHLVDRSMYHPGTGNGL